jgi:DNA-binding response OmpR family regulator
MSEAPHVLIVDDDRDHGAFLAEVVAEHGYDVVSVGDAQEALDVFGKTPSEIVVTDLRMPGMDGVSLISTLVTHPAKPAVIAITAFGSLDTALRVLRAGAADYLSKPFEPKEIVERIRHALEQRARRLEHLRLHEEVDQVLRKRRS